MNASSWRPRNETRQDLDREQRAASYIAEMWGAKLDKLGEVKYRVDWALFTEYEMLPWREHKMLAWAEYRYRDVQRLQYRTFMLAADKWHQLRALSKESGLPSIMFVEWFDDGLFYLNCGQVSSDNIIYLRGGNKTRGQNGDIEPMVHIPVGLFRKVERNNMNELDMFIEAKSDQLNADDLLGGPRTVKITNVSANEGNNEQPINISFEGDDGRPYRPCKSMRRVMVQLWGPYASEYVGRSMTLYRDPTVTWAGMAVGGIRISQMSHIDKEVTLVLAASKKSRKPYVVKPLPKQQKADDDFLPRVKAAIDKCQTPEELAKVRAHFDKQKDLPADVVSAASAAFVAMAEALERKDAKD